MGKLTTAQEQSSSIIWDYPEELVRMKVREFIQTLLEEEVTELLGRRKSERRKPLDSPLAYRNGFGKGRKLNLGLWHHHGVPAQGKGSGGAL
jgi:transposase-like protein